MSEKNSNTIRLCKSRPPSPIYLPKTEGEARDAFIFDSPDAGLEAYLERARAGSAAAQAVVAFMYLNKWIDDGTYLISAARWAKKSANQNNSYGIWVMAWTLLESGDTASGLEAMLSSAEAQFSPALNDLGLFLINGVVFPKDKDTGFALLRIATSLGNSHARRMLEAGYKLGVFGPVKMILMRVFQPLLLVLRAIRWILFTSKFGEKDLVYIRRIHVENALRRQHGDESIGFELERLLDEKLEIIRTK